VYNPDVVIGTESWLKEDISNVVSFRTDFTTFGRDRADRCEVFSLLKTLLPLRNYG